MTLSRRRFLTISAAVAFAPNVARATTWQGRAFGGDIRLTLRGPESVTQPALHKARALIARMERLFSLYDPASSLSQLNRTGALVTPEPDMVQLLEHCNEAWTLTGGLFDPTVQTMWETLSRGENPEPVHSLVGWDRVRISPKKITLGAHQKLTLNGIAQGYATDAVTDMLKAAGLEQILVNIGEHRALGGPWRLGLHDPDHGYLGTRTLTGRAIATSSPNATRVFNKIGHILHPSASPLWSTVSIESETAVLADSLSTGLAMAPLEQIRTVGRQHPSVHRITLIDRTGDLITL